jgi:acid stress-induced BolA-like protein IbaG/YrbA
MTHERLKEILTRRLRLRDPQFRLEGKGRVSGRVVSSTFAGKGDSDRQKLIWDALDAELGPGSVKEVGMLLAYTPDEWDLQLEGHMSPRRTTPRAATAMRKSAVRKKAG